MATTSYLVIAAKTSGSRFLQDNISRVLYYSLETLGRVMFRQYSSYRPYLY